jgi:hypothetical protein
MSHTSPRRNQAGSDRETDTESFPRKRWGVLSDRSCRTRSVLSDRREFIQAHTGSSWIGGWMTKLQPVDWQRHAKSNDACRDRFRADPRGSDGVRVTTSGKVVSDKCGDVGRHVTRIAPARVSQAGSVDARRMVAVEAMGGCVGRVVSDTFGFVGQTGIRSSSHGLFVDRGMDDQTATGGLAETCEIKRRLPGPIPRRSAGRRRRQSHDVGGGCVGQMWWCRTPCQTHDDRKAGPGGIGEF